MRETAPTSTAAIEPAGPPQAIREKVSDLERSSIEAALAVEQGNVTRAAIRLGVSRGALIYKLKKYGIR